MRTLLAGLVLLTGCLPPRAAEPDEPLRATGKLAFSEPGGRLRLVDFAAGRVVKLQADGDAPTLSPDGRTLVFSDVHDGLLALDLASGAVRALAPEDDRCESPAFVGDDEIAFSAQDADDRYVAHVTPLSGWSPRVFGSLPDAHVYSPAWFPGTSGAALALAYTAGSPVDGLVKGVEGREPVVLVGPSVHGASRLLRYPAVSPDGRLVAYTVDAPVNEVWVLDTGSGERRRVTPPSFDGDSCAYPAFSPDGRHLAFLSDRESIAVRGFSTQPHVYVVDLADATKAWQLQDAGEPLTTVWDSISWR